MTAATLAADGVAAHGAPFDVTDEAAVEAAVAIVNVGSVQDGGMTAVV